MSNVFGSTYAQAYDALYQAKDYEAECDLLLHAFREVGSADLGRILDLGSGTGSHANILAQRGLDVVGIDRSEAMTAIAHQKAVDLALDRQPEFITGDIRSARLDSRFDAAIMMFAVLGYQHTNADVIDALATVRAHLDAGGLFAFDVWYGPAVLSERPSDRIQVVETSSGTTIRVASGRLEVRKHLCEVNYRLWTIEGGRLLTEVTERHAVRYFFPLELELLLHVTGFTLRRLGGFPDFATAPTESTWNILVLAQAI